MKHCVGQLQFAYLIGLKGLDLQIFSKLRHFAILWERRERARPGE